MLQKIFDYVMKNGSVSSKKNILAYIKGNPEMVYTKKVVVKLPFRVNGCVGELPPPKGRGFFIQRSNLQ